MPGYHEDPTLTDYVSQGALALTVFSLFISAGAYFPFFFGLNGPSAIGRRAM
ncbi:Putative LOC100900874, partial [Caligus rogercresseyi]